MAGSIKPLPKVLLGLVDFYFKTTNHNPTRFVVSFGVVQNPHWMTVAKTQFSSGLNVWTGKENFGFAGSYFGETGMVNIFVIST